MNALPKPELLLPAGSPEKLRYAVAYGADAVYLGLPMASLRTPNRGEQFSRDNLAEQVHYAQSRGVKAYVTINIFAGNRDLDRVIPHLEQLEAIRPDAIIFSDPGIFRIARKHAPSVPLHLSTQANTLNAEACAFWQDLGISRVILAREVPYREIVEIHDRLPDLELECFVHGSLCVAYSGRCVISDYLTDNTKNSNKGMCGNSCRWEFNEATGEKTGGCSEHSPEEKDRNPESGLRELQMSEATRPNEVYTFEEDDKGSYMLNSKDLCLVGHLRELQEAGVVSFKVEGRTKSVYYVATAGRIYREAIDFYQQHPQATDEQIARWSAELSAAGNRGFTEGFFNGRPTRTGINYQDSQSHQTTRFLATADATGNVSAAAASKGVRFVARNHFKLGERLDWVTPAGAVPFELTALFDADGLPLKEAPTNHAVIIPPPPGVSHDPQWSILRSQERAYAGAT